MPPIFLCSLLNLVILIFCIFYLPVSAFLPSLLFCPRLLLWIWAFSIARLFCFHPTLYIIIMCANDSICILLGIFKVVRYISPGLPCLTHWSILNIFCKWLKIEQAKASNMYNVAIPAYVLWIANFEKHSLTLVNYT